MLLDHGARRRTVSYGIQVEVRVDPRAGKRAVLVFYGDELHLRAVNAERLLGCGIAIVGVLVCVQARDGACLAAADEEVTVLVEAGAFAAGAAGAPDAGARRPGIRHHVDGAVATLDKRGVDKRGAVSLVASVLAGVVHKLVHQLPLPGLASVLGDAHKAVQVLRGVAVNAPARVRAGEQPAVIQGDDRRDAVVLTEPGLVGDKGLVCRCA
ncbi:MAG: hypothetical protein DBX97_25930 [Collinsella tanakaei]|nr:MAG: hypothetical protein DBX97_25930 [Collinsella tanakaei]